MSVTLDNAGKKSRIDQIISARMSQKNFRFEVADFVKEGSRNILDYGFGDGALLLWLRRDKGCRGIYGVEVNPHAVEAVEGLYDKTWLIDLNKEDAHLPDEFTGFFSHVVMPMSLEHTYDPWYILKKVNKYLAPGGKVIIGVPNAQSWEYLYRILTGDFPYVSGGTWDFTHIRHYTLKSLADIANVTGFSLNDYKLIYSNPIDFSSYNSRKEIKVLELPPPEINSGLEKLAVRFPVDVKTVYPLFLAHVLVVQLEKVREPDDYDQTIGDGYLESYRVYFHTQFSAISELINHPICPPLVDRIQKRIKVLHEKHGQDITSE